MKRFQFAICLLFIALTISGNVFSQEKFSDKNANNLLLKAAREIIDSAKICALITTDENGIARARAMDPFTPENDFTIWLGTNKNTRKVQQIKNNPNVTLYYLDPDVSGYVVIYGKAELVNDKKLKDKYWKTKWEAFYPNKTVNYLLIKVTPNRLEVSSVKRGIKGDSFTWQPPGIDFEN